MEIRPEAIELMIQKRHLDGARKLIQGYLVQQNYSKSAQYVASEFYRRISDFNSALRVLRSEDEVKPRSSLDSNEVRNQIQLARILNLLGASSYAVRIVERAPASTRSRHYAQLGG